MRDPFTHLIATVRKKHKTMKTKLKAFVRGFKEGMGSSPIHDAAQRGNLELLDKLLRDDPKLVSSKNSAGETPLFEAVRKPRLDVVDLLLSNGAKVNVQSKNGVTPLHAASSFNYFRSPPPECIRIVALLLSKGANVNAQDNHGETPYRCANMLGNREAVALLLSKGADPSLGPQDMVAWMFSKKTKADSEKPDEAEKKEQRAGNAGAFGRNLGWVVGTILGFCYAISPLNPNRGHPLSVEQDVFLVFFAIVVCPIVGYGIGHKLGKK